MVETSLPVAGPSANCQSRPRLTQSRRQLLRRRLLQLQLTAIYLCHASMPFVGMNVVADAFEYADFIARFS